MPTLKLRIKISDFEYEAEGEQDTVCSQFEVFRNLIGGTAKNTLASDFASPPSKPDLPQQLGRLPTPSPTPPSGNFLHRLFIHDPLTSRLTCRVLPSGPTKMADTMLLLLLGNQEILREQSISAVALNQALTRSGGTVARLDRVLAAYLRDQWVLKSGKGKGGKYRLSKLGTHHAWDKAAHLVNLLPEEPN